MLVSEAAVTMVHTQVRELNSRHPSRRSRRKGCAGSGRCAGSRSRVSMVALTAKVAASAAILAAGSLIGTRAEAMTLGGPAGIREAADAVSPVEKTACWRWGWRGWGWYPCYYRSYGWRGYGWRWRRW